MGQDNSMKRAILMRILVTGKEDNINSEATFYKCDITEIEKLKIVFEV